jgi:hypothetical protein
MRLEHRRTLVLFALLKVRSVALLPMLLFSSKGVAQALIFVVEKLILNLQGMKCRTCSLLRLSTPVFHRII